VAYQQSMSKLPTKHILLCVIVIGSFTLPVAVMRRSRTKLVLTARTVRWTTGVASVTTDDYRLLWVSNVATQRRVFDRMFGCGTLTISTDQGQTDRYKSLEHVEDARAKLQARVVAQTPQST
jgi:hypothetical protein